MAIEVIQLHGEDDVATEQDATKDKSSVGYKITGTTDKYAAYAALAAAAPMADGVLVRDAITVKHDVAEHWDATVNYVTIEKQKKDPDIGELEWDFDTTGGTQHITHGLDTVQSYIAQNWVHTEFFNAIGVKKTKHGFDIAGIDIVIPKLELTCTTSFAPGTVTIEWIKALAEMTGKTNDQVWKTFEKGELLFMGARIKARYREKTTVTFSFSASENITAADQITVGDGQPGQGQAAGIGPIVKAGHEHMWVEFINWEFPGQNVVAAKPVQVNVEQVYREADFNELGLGN